MTTSTNPQGQPTNDLRKRAEQRVPKTATDVSVLSAAEIARLVYELEVHQEELEIQNEELRRVQQELQESRDRYLDLYDFAPVGYLTLDAAGCIVEANLTAAAMLGVERSKLIGTRLALYCDQGSKPTLRSYLEELIAIGKRQVREVSFTGKATFCAQLESSCVAVAEGGAARCLVVMTDVTQRKIVEEQSARRRIIEKRLVHLNAKERAVYELLLQGKSNKVIANELDVGLRTVERRRHVILEKLHVDSLAELLHQFANIQSVGALPNSLSGGG